MKCPRRLRLLLALAVLPGLPACQRPEEPLRPADLLPRPQLVGTLVDLHLLEARVESSGLSPDSSRALYLAQQRVVFRKHQLTEAAFQHSVHYYGVHNKDLDEIYAVVVDSLETRVHRFKPNLPKGPLPPGSLSE